MGTTSGAAKPVWDLMMFSPGVSDLNLSNSSSGYPYVAACAARMADRIGPGAKTAVKPFGTESVPGAAATAGLDGIRRTAVRCGALLVLRASRAETEPEGRVLAVAVSPLVASARGEAAASPAPPINAVPPSAAVRTPTHSHRAPGAARTPRFITIPVRYIC